MYYMRIELKPETVQALEDASGQKLSKNGDQIIREIAEKAQDAEVAENGSGLEMTVCDVTKKEMEQDA